MGESIKLRVVWNRQSAAQFDRAGVRIPWGEKDLLTVTSPEAPMTIDDVSSWIEARVDRSYARETGGEDTAQVQIRSIHKQNGSPDMLDWLGHARRLLSDGDTIIIDASVVTDAMGEQMRPSYTEADLNNFRAKLRFGLNDKVLCNCGPRWFSGNVVGTAVPDDDMLLPYLVKTDPTPGFPSKTISVPYDEDEVCVQQVCFDPRSEAHLVKAAAALLPGSRRPKLRFAAGDGVACRVKNDPKDGLESWVVGKVASIWPELPGPLDWKIEGVSGVFPSVVAYKVSFSNGDWVYCHRDHHSLVRREGMQPRTRVKGTSKRMEVVIAKDGTKQKIDHQTERCKRALESESDPEI